MIFQPRLYNYQTVLGKYDLLDKYKFSKIKFSVVDNIKVLYTSYKLVSPKLNFLLLNEFSTQQRVWLTDSSEYTFNIFWVTLRWYSMFSYFEFLLNSIFLFNKFSTFISNSFLFINWTFGPSSNNEFFNYLNELNPNLNKFILILKFQNLNLKSFMSYYFIPYKF